MASDSDGMLLGEKNVRPSDIETDLQKSGYYDGAKQVGIWPSACLGSGFSCKEDKTWKSCS